MITVPRQLCISVAISPKVKKPLASVLSNFLSQHPAELPPEVAITGARREFVMLDLDRYNQLRHLALQANVNVELAADSIVAFSTRGFKLDVEKQWQAKLAKQLGASREVHCPVGIIDLLLPTKVIEVKQAAGFKSALGQVLSYGAFYRGRSLALALFGTSNYCKADIEQVCGLYNVEVIWLDNSHA